jgi:hypothetical protein
VVFKYNKRFKTDKNKSVFRSLIGCYVSFKQGGSLKIFYVLFLFWFLASCASEPPTKLESEVQSSQKIIITGTRLKRTDVPPGPKLKMSLNKKNKNSNFMDVLAVMQTLPQPKDIGDCLGLLSALKDQDLIFTIMDSNSIILEGDQGIYEYTFDDDSCPVDET